MAKEYTHCNYEPSAPIISESVMFSGSGWKIGYAEPVYQLKSNFFF